MRVFLSYAQADQAFRDQLVKHLKQIERDRILETWDAHEITGGTEREQTIAQQLDAADIILLLISADFIASDRHDVEMQRAIERHDNQEARVIPILIRSCDWESAPFGKFQPLPRNRQPVSAWDDPDAAFTDIAQEIRRVAIELNPALAKPKKSPMKPGAPLQGVPLPDNFVERPEALNSVKAMLLEESEKPLVVSAIAGLGGLGKSVLAAALVLDAEVQARFEDGILWVTLGQNPDLQQKLGEWIQELDKSRESYSATTLESASRYLQTLLIEKRMLLVVDDVWNGAHVEHFRVGGDQCRVLVTTREAQIDGAEYHPLDLMTEEQAIELVRQKLKRQWQADQEAEVKAFAKSLGYLPLALDLAANQVKDGFSWAELREEFEAERRAVALEVLDSSEAWETLEEKKQRKCSLRACFNLSLRRLSAEQLRQFAWLGVLPEDVTLDVRMAMTLWELPKLQAKKALLVLKNRSFLTSGTETLEGEPTYRVHDLMHDTARGLIEQGTISSAIQTLPAAHAQLLERYRAKANDRWDQVPNDGYIHRHLTWHLEQAGLEDEIHALLAMSDEQGRNAWFETCDRIGQPAIFVEDVKRAWSIAEQSYEEDNTRSIVLQCRYALITATLNSLVNNLPIDMMAEFVKRQYWTPEKAWAYVEQMQDESKIAEAIEKLVKYLPQPILKLVVEKMQLIQDEFSRARILSALAQVDATYFLEALGAVRVIQNEHRRAEILNALVQVDSAYFSEVLNVARLMQCERNRARVLSAFAKADSTYFSEALETARLIQDDCWRAFELSILAQVNSSCILEALNTARLIQSELTRSLVLSNLVQADSAYISETWETARLIQHEYDRALVLCTLAKIDSTYFPKALDVARSIQDKGKRAEVLSILAQINSIYFPEALETIQLIRDEHWIRGHRREKALSTLAQVNSIYFTQVLAEIRSIRDEYGYFIALYSLTQVNSAYFPEALDTAQSIQNKYTRATALHRLAQIDSTYFSEMFDTVRSIEDNYSRALILRDLAQADSTYFSEALDTAKLIEDEFTRALVLRDLAQIDSANLPELLDAARTIQQESCRVRVLIGLAQVDSAYISELLSTMQFIQEEPQRLWIWCELAKIDSAYFPEALNMAVSIQAPSSCALAFSTLAQIDSAYFPKALNMAVSIQDTAALHVLAQADSADFAQLLNAVQLIQDENCRASVLSDLASKLPETLLLQAHTIIHTIGQNSTRAEAFSFYLSHLPLATLSPIEWRSYLHLLAYRTRADLMQDLATLYPAIVHLGGKEAARGMVDAMREVCQQWK